MTNKVSMPESIDPTQIESLKTTLEGSGASMLPGLRKFEWMQPKINYRSQCAKQGSRPDPRAFETYIANCVSEALSFWKPCANPVAEENAEV
jgi:hypothetical protein